MIDEFIKDLVDNAPVPTPFDQRDEDDRLSKTRIRNNEQNNGEQNFNPDIHVTDDNGNPVRTRNGKLRKKPGRKKNDDSVDSISGQSQTGKKPPHQLSNKEAGKIATAMIVTPAIMFLGEEVTPNQTEYNAMSNAWGTYFEENGISDMPAWVLVATTTLSWIGPKMVSKPVPRNKAKLFLQNSWLNIKYLFGKTKNAFTNRRDDGKRKNDTRQADMFTPPQNGSDMSSHGSGQGPRMVFDIPNE